MKKVLVVGGGPAGMMAAITSSLHGAQVTLIEKKERLGSKLKITGKGRCNLTSASRQEDFIDGYPGNGRFLYSALNEFSSLELIRFFEKSGVKTKTERGNRVFPQSDQAVDVIEALYKNLIKNGVEIICGTAVKNLLVKHGQVSGLDTGKGFIPGEAIIVATGGMSYPGTGSTGDGYKWASELGHRIITPRPGLIPLVSDESWIPELQGLSLRNVKAAAYQNNGWKINEEFGEMLFTHDGVSGPIILTMSSDIARFMDYSRETVKLLIDLKPALSEEKLDLRVQRDLALYSRKRFKNSLHELLPRKLIPVIIKLSGINPEKASHQVSKAERKTLVSLLKNVSLSIKGTRPITEAIVTAGGVDTREINPRTMQSRIIKGLYFAGEVIDVDGYTGGYNLQAAFSTGYVAGKSSASL